MDIPFALVQLQKRKNKVFLLIKILLVFIQQVNATISTCFRMLRYVSKVKFYLPRDLVKARPTVSFTSYSHYKIVLLEVSIYPSIYLFIFPSIHLSTYSSLHLSIYSSIHLPIYRSIHLSINPSIDLSIDLFIDLQCDSFSMLVVRKKQSCVYS